MNKFSRKVMGGISPLLILFLTIPFFSANVKPKLSVNEPLPEKTVTTNPELQHEILTVGVYEALNLRKVGLSYKAFEMAFKGYETLREQGRIQNSNILTVIDFSKPSTQKRLYVMDMEQMKILFNTYVSHGRNSGKLYANKFSNKPESHMSSLGFYTTGDTYFGAHGYSLRLNGEEKGINDNAAERAIVIHSADYASAAFAQNQGYLGRSYGCPALPKELSKPIIETIKDGSCLFVYAPSKNYTSKSQIL